MSYLSCGFSFVNEEVEKRINIFFNLPLFV